MGLTQCPEMSVQNYRSVLHNIPEERRSHLHHGGSLKSNMDVDSPLLLWRKFLMAWELVWTVTMEHNLTLPVHGNKGGNCHKWRVNWDAIQVKAPYVTRMYWIFIVFWNFSYCWSVSNLVSLKTGWQIIELLCGWKCVLKWFCQNLPCDVWLLWAKYQDLVFCQIVLHLSPLMPVTNLHHSLIYALLFSF
jgi:hypothetical protein